MKKNGFISISIVYSFFLVFLALILYIVCNLVNNRVLLNNVKNKVKNDISNNNLARFLMNNYNELNITYYNDEIEFGPKDNSFRFTGDNPNNYICLGVDKDTCLDNQEIYLYRIIGVINGKVKLIKNEGIGYFWLDIEDSNVYKNSFIYNYLNIDEDSYINEYLNDYKSIIDKASWYTGGLNYEYLNSPIKEIYDNEVGEKKNNSGGVVINAYLGLPYISDIAYGSFDESVLTGAFNNFNNWLVIDEMWTISRADPYYNKSYYISVDYFDFSGSLDIDDVDSIKQIVPCLYLKGSVRVLNGDASDNTLGTIDNPYLIKG